MKKVIILLLALTLVLSGCSAATPTATTPTTTAPTTTIAPTTTAPTTTATTVETTRVTSPPTTTAQPGTRTNPAPLGMARTVTADAYNAKYEYTITLLEVIRGAPAKAIIMKENQFNKIPDGKEAILAKFKFDLNKYDPTNENEGLSVSDYSFDFFNKTYTKLVKESIMAPNEFSGEIFEGGTLTGYVGIFAPIGEKVIVRYEDFVWFNIG